MRSPQLTPVSLILAACFTITACPPAADGSEGEGEGEGEGEDEILVTAVSGTVDGEEFGTVTAVATTQASLEGIFLPASGSAIVISESADSCGNTRSDNTIGIYFSEGFVFAPGEHPVHSGRSTAEGTDADVIFTVHPAGCGTLFSGDSGTVEITAVDDDGTVRGTFTDVSLTSLSGSPAGTLSGSFVASVCETPEGMCQDGA